MENNKPPFRFEIVGSFLRPANLKDAREKFLNKEISKEDLTAIENKEIEILVKKQIDLGLKAVTDGEFRRRWWHLDFLSSLNGISVFDVELDGGTFNDLKTVVQKTYVSDKLSFNKNHPFLEHFKFTKSIAGNTLVKQTIPGPNMIYLDSFILSEKYKQNPIYETTEDFINDLVTTYQDIIKSFYNAGCRYLQLDDTSWGALFSNVFIDTLKKYGKNLEDLINEFGDITERVLENKPNDLTIGFHMCKGNFMSRWLYEGSYEVIAKRLFSIENIDGFFIEYDDERSGSFEPLKYLKNQKIILGLITTKNSKLENKDFIINRIKEASKYIPLERICISPQCGFASTQEGNNIDYNIQWEKINLLKEISEEVWK